MKLLERPPVMRPVRLASPYRPAQHRVRIGQLNIDPNIDINAPVSINLGALPVTIGLFSASAVSFLIGTQVEGSKGVTSVLGILLAAGGVANIFLGDSLKDGTAPNADPSLPGGGGVDVSPPIIDTPEQVFAALDARVISPAEAAKVDIGFFAGSVPIRVRIDNPSDAPASFDLVLAYKEQPEPTGALLRSSETVRIDIGAGEKRDYDIDLPLNTWGTVTAYIELDLEILKRRTSGGDATRLDSRFFELT